MSGSVFERNGRWYFRIPAKTSDGRYTQIWKSDPKWSKSDAEKAKSKAEVERDGRGNVAPSKLTLGGWVELWLADRKITMKNSSGYRDYAMILRDYVVYQGKDPKTGKHVKPTAISKVKLKDLRRKHFNDLYRGLESSLLILSGMHPKMIQARMRHRDFSTTMNVYGHLMSDAEASDPVLSELDLLLARDS